MSAPNQQTSKSQSLLSGASIVQTSASSTSQPGAQVIVQSPATAQSTVAQQVLLTQSGQRIQLGGQQNVQNIQIGGQSIQIPAGQRIQLTTANGQRIILPQQGLSQAVLQQLQKQGQRIVVQQTGQPSTTQQVAVQQPQAGKATTQQVVGKQQQHVVVQQQKPQQILIQQPQQIVVQQPHVVVQQSQQAGQQSTQQQQKLILQQQKTQQKLLQQQILQKQQQRDQLAQKQKQTIRVLSPAGQQVRPGTSGVQVVQLQSPGQVGQGVQKIVITKEQLHQMQLKGGQAGQIIVRPPKPAQKPKTVADHVAAHAQKSVTVKQLIKPAQSPSKPIIASAGQQILVTGATQNVQSPVKVSSPLRPVAPAVRVAVPASIAKTAPTVAPQVTAQPVQTLNLLNRARVTSPAVSNQALQTVKLLPGQDKKGLKTILPAQPQRLPVTQSLLTAQQSIQPKSAPSSQNEVVLPTSTGVSQRLISLVSSAPVLTSATPSITAIADTNEIQVAIPGGDIMNDTDMVVEEVEVNSTPHEEECSTIVMSPIKTKEHQKAKQKAAKLKRQQDKANKIILEAIKKAKNEGRELPPHAEPLPTDADLDVEVKPKKEKKSKKEKKEKPKKEKIIIEKAPKPLPLKKKSTKVKKALPESLVKRKERRKRQREEVEEASDGEMADIVVKANNRKFYIPPDIDEECKRRSGRNTKRRKYNDELELDLSESESSDDQIDVDDSGIPEKKKKKSQSPKKGGKKKPEPVQHHSESSHQSSTVQAEPDEEENIVEKILGMRTGTRTRNRPDVDVDILGYDDIEIPQETVQVEEFYVKYRNYSYLHCEWKTDEELYKGDKRIHQKIKRFKIHKLPYMDRYLVDEEDLFNQDYIEVDRVLDKAVTYEPPDNEMVIHYLVKWQSMPYEEATWELEKDVDNELIERWTINQILPPENERAAIARPRPYRWHKISKSPVYRNDNTLREYQLEGVNWLNFCYHNKQNCILADEMGLGKTIQSIAFLKTVFDYGIKGPFLVIVPLSTLANWQREFDLWTNMNAVTYHGTAGSRRMIQDYEFYFRDEKLNIIPDIYKFHALITTYEIIISDVELLSSIEWRVAIIDEAHRLKNKNCKLAEGLKYFDMEHRVLLTGTPLQNNTEELFSLLNFLEPSRFNSVDEFLKDFGELTTEAQVKQLKSLLKPMMLRRLKEDVEKNLAPKEETIVEVEMTNTQKKFYRAILERNFSFLAKGGTSSNVPNLMNTMMELRKCCNHPYLIDGAEPRVLAETRERYGDRPDTTLKALVQSCGKMVLLDKLLPKLFAGKHRVLIFSQMIRVLDILEDYLIQKGYLFERLDGRIRGNHRQEAIDRFSRKDSDKFVFLLCTRAGGLGINLTAADTVIIYDSDWNPQNDLQAQARCHRIGQKKAVKMYRLITRNSYEREMFDKASLKLGLDKAILQSGKNDQNDKQSSLSKREIEDLLKKGAYGAVMDDENAADSFCEEDIDLILERRTQVIQVESAGKGSTFAKASFSASGNRDDIDIDDPEFWQKWAKKAEIDPDSAELQLIVEEPRKRKQTARYGGQDSITNMSELDTSDEDSDKEKKKKKDPDEKDEDVEDPDEVERKRKEKKKQSKRKRRKESAPAQESSAPPALPRDTGFVRSEMFKVEKNMMVFGYGRWDDIHQHARFRRRVDTQDVENIAKALLLYSLRYYAGDERIKRFIYDLVNPKADVDYKNHTGLSAPVPRGRKGKKNKEQAAEKAEDLEAEILAQTDIDAEKILRDDGYKKHLQRHANKVLLRVRLLYYLKQEVIGNENADMITAGVNHEIIDLPPVSIDNNVKPCDWWDEEADKSLLIGVFKHGYEKFQAIRQDPCLCFLERCGPPDDTALAREQNGEDYEDRDEGKPAPIREEKGDDDEGEDPDREEGEIRDEEDSEQLPSAPQKPPEPALEGKLPFPSFSDLNTRFRRVITGYQKLHKRQLHKMAKHEKKRERIEAVTKEREQKKRDSQQRWSRREEMDFYRIVSSYGVEYNVEEKRYIWDKFRFLARLEKKYDETMSDYFLAFYFMCCCVCKRLSPEAAPPNELTIEPITEERATRCLARIDLLNKIREETLRHPELDERLQLCEYGHDLPDWWHPGKHDKELLKGAARHGLARTDYHILHDPDLLFKEIVQNKSMYVPTPSGARQTGDSSDDENYAHDRPVINGQAPFGVKLEPVDDSTEVKIEPGLTDPHLKKTFSVKEMVAKIKAETAAKEMMETAVKEEDLENESHEPTVAELLAKNVAPAVQWPKDRTVFHRLDQVCTCVEKGEWPFMKRGHSYGTSRDLDSYNSTPVGTPRPGRGDTPVGELDDWNCQNDGLKMTIGKRKYKREKADFEEAMRNEYGDSGSEYGGNTSMHSYFNKSPSDTKKKRGRRTKIEKMIMEAQARHEAVERMMVKAQQRLEGFNDPEYRVSVVNHENGDRLVGDEAPQRRYIASWLNKNPGYTIDLPYAPEDDLDSKWKKKPRRHKVDPAKLDWEKLTGEENVSVVNTVTGKRVTGAKAPELRYLSRFLEHNPNYCVDSKWAHLVRTKANLPDKYMNRILNPASDKSPRLPQHTHPLLQQSGQKLLTGASLLGMNDLNPSVLSNLYGMQIDDSKNEEAIKALVKAAQQKQQQQQQQQHVVINPMIVNQLGQSIKNISIPNASSIPSQITTTMTMAEAQAALKNGIILNGGKILKATPPTMVTKKTVSISPRSLLKVNQPQLIKQQQQQVVVQQRQPAVVEELFQPQEIVLGGMETVGMEEVEVESAENVVEDVEVDDDNAPVAAESESDSDSDDDDDDDDEEDLAETSDFSMEDEDMTPVNREEDRMNAQITRDDMDDDDSDDVDSSGDDEDDDVDDDEVDDSDDDS